MFKTTINIEDIRSTINAVDNLQCAGKHEDVKKILVDLAKEIKVLEV